MKTRGHILFEMVGVNFGPECRYLRYNDPSVRNENCIFDDTHRCFCRIWDRYWDIREWTYKCRYPCSGNILSGGGAISSIVCIVIVGYVGGYEKGSGGNPYKLSKTDHRGEGTDKHRWDVVNTVVRRGVEVIFNLYSGHIHRPHTGDGGALDLLKTDLWSLWKEARFQ